MSSTKRLLFLLSVLLCSSSGRAEEVAATAINFVGLDQNRALKISHEALGRSIGEHALLDRDGRPMRLGDFRGKPLLVSFIYTGCFQVCPATTKLLQKAVHDAQETLGTNNFHVISIGFNQPADSPQALKSYALQFGITESNWEFLSPAAADVANLAGDFGFSYVATAAGFDHLLQVTVVDPDSKIYRQVYGDRFTPDQLTEPLRQLINRSPLVDTTNFADLIERVRILCSVYDPLTGKYKVSYGLAIEIAGGLTFLAWILWFFGNEWWVRRRHARQWRA